MRKSFEYITWWLGAFFGGPMIVVFLIHVKLMDMKVIKHFFPNIEAENLDALSWVCLVILGLTTAGIVVHWIDTNETTHSCDICGNKLKVGEGQHTIPSEKNENCYCVCSKCLPTVKK